MSNRYGITKQTELRAIPHGTSAQEILELPEVKELIQETNVATLEFVRKVCDVSADELPTLDTITVTNILRSVQDVLRKSNTGLQVIRPSVTRTNYSKRIY